MPVKECSRRGSYDPKKQSRSQSLLLVGASRRMSSQSQPWYYWLVNKSRVMMYFLVQSGVDITNAPPRFHGRRHNCIVEMVICRPPRSFIIVSKVFIRLFECPHCLCILPYETFFFFFFFLFVLFDIVVDFQGPCCHSTT